MEKVSFPGQAGPGHDVALALAGPAREHLSGSQFIIHHGVTKSADNRCVAWLPDMQLVYAFVT
jgi:hypothetical protein